LPTHGVLSSNDSLLVTSGSLIIPSGPITLINHTYTEYCGNHILENGKLKQSLFDGGYITYSDGEPEFHFYVRDHQGNNRLVMSEDGVVEQVNDYTPFGVQMKNSFTATSSQRYKYNGKELDRMFGLDLYDYGARFYDARIARWQTIDPLCEKYYSISPYVYCANNPINAYDPDGKLIIFINGFYVTPTEGGDKSYWRSYKNWHFSFSAYPVHYRREKIYEFDIDVMRYLKDSKAKYVDGSLGGAIGMLCNNMSTAAEVRRQNGETIGLIDAPSIISSLTKDKDGNITEHIKVITHSMGSAYAKGYISSILKYADDNGIKGIIIDFEADFAPYNTQSQEAIKHPNMGPTYQFSHSQDIFAGNKKISGAQMMDTSSDANQTHSIGSFVPQIQNIPSQ
jgi:RHS repeat-associated protein